METSIKILVWSWKGYNKHRWWVIAFVWNSFRRRVITVIVHREMTGIYCDFAGSLIKNIRILSPKSFWLIYDWWTRFPIRIKLEMRERYIASILVIRHAFIDDESVVYWQSSDQMSGISGVAHLSLTTGSCEALWYAKWRLPKCFGHNGLLVEVFKCVYLNLTHSVC